MADPGQEESDMGEVSAEEQAFFEVEKVIGKTKSRGTALYKVRWKSYGPDDDTWEPYENLSSCQDLVEEYEAKQQELIKQRSEERKRRKVQSMMEGKTETERSSDTKACSVDTSLYPPNFKNSFWKELEAGRINVFDNDMYTKVKSRMCKSASSTESSSAQSSLPSKEKKKSKRRDSKKDSGKKGSGKSSAKSSRSSKDNSRRRSDECTDTKLFQSSAKKLNFVLETDSDSSSGNTAHSLKTDIPESGSTENSSCSSLMDLCSQDGCADDNNAIEETSTSATCSMQSSNSRSASTAKVEDDHILETKSPDKASENNLDSDTHPVHPSNSCHSSSISQSSELVKKRKRQVSTAGAVSISETFNKSKQAKLEKDSSSVEIKDTVLNKNLDTVEENDLMLNKNLETVEEKDTLLNKNLETVEEKDTMLNKNMETIEGPSKSSPVVPVSQTSGWRAEAASSCRNTSDDLTSLKPFPSTATYSPGLEGYLHRSSSGQIIVSKVSSQRGTKDIDVLSRSPSLGNRRNSGSSDWLKKDRVGVKKEPLKEGLDSGIASPASENGLDFLPKKEDSDYLQPLDEILNSSAIPLLSDTEKSQDRGVDLELEIELDDVDWELFEQEVKLEPILLSEQDFCMAVESGDYDMVKRALLGDKKYDLESRSPSGKSLLMAAVEKVYDDIADLLIQHGADVNTQDQLGMTALMTACENAEICTVNLLLERGALVNMYQVAGETALIIAAKRGHKQMLWLLLQHGANFSMVTQTGYSALGFLKVMHSGETENIITSHINRVKSEFDKQVSITLNNTARIITDLFPLQCFPICDGQKFQVRFDHTQLPHTPGVGYLLFVAHAMFYNQEVKCRFYGPSAITSVVLNGVQQSSLTEEPNFVMSFSPLVHGRNELVINTVHAKNTKAKLLVHAYRTQLI